MGGDKPREGVPRYDGACGICGKGEFRDALQYVNHVEALHVERDHEGAEAELKKAELALDGAVDGSTGEELEGPSDPAGLSGTRGGGEYQCQLCGREDFKRPLALLNHVSVGHVTKGDEGAQWELQRAQNLVNGTAPGQGGEPVVHDEEPAQGSALEDLEDRGLENLAFGDEGGRRQARVRDLVLAWLDQKDLNYKVDKYGVLHVELPVGPGTPVAEDWQITFDRETAHERLVEYVTYTNRHFQRILRDVTDKPVLAYRLVLTPEIEDDISGWHEEVARTDFSFHISYSTYGETREEFFSTTIGEVALDTALLSDAFHPEPFELPSIVREHYTEALSELQAHVKDRFKDFAKIAAEQLESELERLENLKSHEKLEKVRGQKQLAEDQRFYREAVERQKGALDARYRADVSIRLLTVEPYFVPGGTEE